MGNFYGQVTKKEIPNSLQRKRIGFYFSLGKTKSIRTCFLSNISRVKASDGFKESVTLLKQCRDQTSALNQSLGTPRNCWGHFMTALFPSALTSLLDWHPMKYSTFSSHNIPLMTCTQWKLHKCFLNEKVTKVKKSMTISLPPAFLICIGAALLPDGKVALGKYNNPASVRSLPHISEIMPHSESNVPAPRTTTTAWCLDRKWGTFRGTDVRGDKFERHQNLHLSFIQLLDTNIMTCHNFWEYFSGQECFFKKQKT